MYYRNLNGQMGREWAARRGRKAHFRVSHKK